MNDLPELPLKKVLSYLSLEDRNKMKVVSRWWYTMIKSFRTRDLCYSGRNREEIIKKSRLVTGTFAQNFIRSPVLDTFYELRSPPVGVQHLRLTNFQSLSGVLLINTLHRFECLQSLDLIRVGLAQPGDLNLNLPTVKSVHLETFGLIAELNLNAPNLKSIKVYECDANLRVTIACNLSVTTLIADDLNHIRAFNRLSNLERLFTRRCEIRKHFLNDFPALTEIHLDDRESVLEILAQSSELKRLDLKVFRFGCPVKSQHDALVRHDGEWYTAFHLLVENHFRLADEIPLYNHLEFTKIIENMPAGPDVDDLMSRLSDLSIVIVYRQIHDPQRLLDFLGHSRVVELVFQPGPTQPADLFLRLPNHCEVQVLELGCRVRSYNFVTGFQDLVWLNISQNLEAKEFGIIFRHLLTLESMIFFFYFDEGHQFKWRKRERWERYN